MPSPDYGEPVSAAIEAGVPQPKQHNTLRKTSMRQLLVICFSVGVFMPFS